VQDPLRALTVAAWQDHNPDLDTSPMEIVALINAIGAAFDAAAEQVYSGAELSAAEMKLLVPLRFSSEPVTAVRLAERLNMSRAGVSKTLSRLEARGIIERRHHPTDRRAAVVRLTADGIHLIDRLFPQELDAHARLLAGLGPERLPVVAALTALASAVAPPTR